MTPRKLSIAFAKLVAGVIVGGIALTILACSAPATRHLGTFAAVPSPISQTGTTPPPLVVDNAAATNPNLVPTTLTVPAGFATWPHTVLLPPGFSISVLAAGLSEPRFMAFDPGGNLVVGSLSGGVYRLPASIGSIPAGSIPAVTGGPAARLLTGLTAPHSVAFSGGFLYVAETGALRRYAYGADGSLGAPERVIGNLPSNGGHFTRTVVFGPDGTLYLGVGSSCNICVERDERRAAIARYNTDGSGYVRFGWGTRNPVGLAVQPTTGVLWATVNERDDQGNEIPPDLVTIVRQGDNFGWPNCQPPNAVPQHPGNDCSGITPPTVAIQAHSAPLGLAFYTGNQFPAEYQNDLFVVQHGSWNREPPAPPQLIRIHFEGGRPVSVRAFATGWQTNDSGSRWGRPAGIVVAPDGSLIVSDDTAGLIYRISYASK